MKDEDTYAYYRLNFKALDEGPCEEVVGSAVFKLTAEGGSVAEA